MLPSDKCLRVLKKDFSKSDKFAINDNKKSIYVYPFSLISICDSISYV